MNASLAVIIVKSEHTVALKKRLGPNAAVSVFPDSDSLQAGDAILARPPKILAMDATFATTARGATLVAQLKSEARLNGVDLRVLIEDEAKVPLILSETTASPETALLQTSRPLDRAGTRRAVRYLMNRRAVLVNGEHSHLVDLSTTGAQVIVPMRVRPTQHVRLILSDQSTDTKCQGVVAWSVAVPTGASVRYRAGIEFVSPDTARLEAFCIQHGGAADRTFGAR
jgi:hypothetical protein